MRWRGERESDNVVDERGKRSAGIGGISVTGVAIALVVSYLTGQNPIDVLTQLLSSSTQQSNYQSSYQSTPEDEESKKLLSVVLGSTEDVWGEEFKKLGTSYRAPKLVLFTDGVSSACGFSGAATGPFYCPGDERLYIDLGFLRQLQKQLGADGDFAAAYVLAHEVGHHVQTILKLNRPSTGDSSRSVGEDGNQVKTELQADCLAGVWGFFAQRQGLLEVGDVEQGINAAKAVGDDRIQSMGGGTVNPDAFTHGSSRERADWFKKGLSSGSIKSCDTFGIF